MTALSVLDQGPVRVGGAPGHALHDALELARVVEELGYRRYWVAEHHSTAMMGTSAPEILIGHLAAHTTRLRLGTGGMMLPNHRPLHLAEQFRTLNALYPGRIDLGVGRSSGTGDETTAAALGWSRERSDRFEELLAELLGHGGLRPLPAEHPYATLRAVPVEVPLPPVHVLGSSVSSAERAARAGLPYAFFAAYVNPDVAVTALRRYREAFVPHTPDARPHAVLALRVWAGEDDEHAHRIAAPAKLAVLQILTGQDPRLVPEETALAHRPTEAERAVAAPLDQRSDVIGGPDTVRERLEALTEASGADEIMALTNTYDPGERRASYRRLAEALRITPAVAAHPPRTV
ncbi:luciferase [Streptomyces incarnatus]|uniref:Luciferase n=1 Tax=Streptomyces incarnatus TaxID=665007 RepID=A0ABM5TCV2_9ACTN|nr:LLM class flavin-dependent oxidoreductase [Streptomyces incarnatus]AKJ08810.1 luciferase [Streptomyces incarnatus]